MKLKFKPKKTKKIKERKKKTFHNAINAHFLLVEYYRCLNKINLTFKFIKEDTLLKSFTLEDVNFDHSEEIKDTYDGFLKNNGINKINFKTFKVVFYNDHELANSYLEPNKIFFKNNNLEDNEMKDIFGPTYKDNNQTISFTNKVNKYNKSTSVFMIPNEDLRNVKLLGLAIDAKAISILTPTLAYLDQYNNLLTTKNEIIVDNHEKYLNLLVFVNYSLIDSLLIIKEENNIFNKIDLYALLASLKENNQLVEEEKSINDFLILNDDQEIYEELIKNNNNLDFNFHVTTSYINEYILRKDKGYNLTRLVKGNKKSKVEEGNTIIEVVVAFLIFSLSAAAIFVTINKLTTAKSNLDEYNNVYNYLDNAYEDYINMNSHTSTLLPTLNVGDNQNYLLDKNFTITTGTDSKYLVYYNYSEKVTDSTSYTLDQLSILTISSVTSGTTYHPSKVYTRIR